MALEKWQVNALRLTGSFACHAALPLALTPDLLYCLWANFSQDISELGQCRRQVRHYRFSACGCLSFLCFRA